ncbi:MAG: CvpA family protein [Eubacteriales bacterium]|nr:CvpA family protein [Eubacteriales bacterium]
MLVDLVIVLILLICLIRGWLRGFLYNAGLVFLLLISFFIASTFSGILATKLYQVGVDKKILKSGPTQLVQQFDREKDLEDNLQNLGLTESYQKILQGDLGELMKGFSTSVEKIGAESQAYMKEMTQAVSEQILRLSLQILVFIFLLFASYFLLKFFLKLISKGINALPVLGLVNRLGGAGLGLALGILLAGTLISVLPGLAASFPALEDSLAGSKLADFLVESQLYKWILQSIFA